VSRVSESTSQPQGKNWQPLPTSPLSIQHLDYSPDVACRPTILFPNVPKGRYPVCTKQGPTVDVSTSRGLRWSQGLSLEIVMMKTNSTDEEREPRGKCWLRLGSSTLGCRRRQRQWLARVVLYEAFSPKSTITFVPLLSFLLHFYRLTLAHLFWHSYIVMLYVNHYPRKQDNDDILINTFVLLLANQQCYFARWCCILWSLFSVPDHPYLVQLVCHSGSVVAVSCSDLWLLLSLCPAVIWIK